VRLLTEMPYSQKRAPHPASLSARKEWREERNALLVSTTYSATHVTGRGELVYKWRKTEGSFDIISRVMR
jgi:hypothetical protein